MSSQQIVEIELTSVRFFSPYDEAAFFEWIKKLACVKKCEGRGLTIHLSVHQSAVDEDALRELIALFHRYEVDMRQLARFDRVEFEGWFHNKQAYWYKQMFPIKRGNRVSVD